MRIALVSCEYVTENFSGGLANYVHRVARGLGELGVEAEVFFLSDGDEALMHEGIRVHRVHRGGSRAERLMLRALPPAVFGTASHSASLCVRGLALRRCLARRHARAPFDLVQYCNLQGLGAFRLGIPSVVRLSSYADLWLPHGFSETFPFEQKLEDISLRRADGVFGPSRWVAEYVGRKLGVDAEVIESPFVPEVNPEDASVYEARLADKRYGLYFGAMTNYKGIYVLADALATFLERQPGLHFVFVGPDRVGYGRDGKKPSEVVLQALARFGSRVTHIEQLPHAQLYPVVRGAELVVMPSLAENLSNASIEAMHLGRVLIGTDGRSFEQLIVDGESGFLCQPGDVPSLLDAMERALALSDEQRTEMGRRAQARVHELRPEVTVAQLLDYYGRVLAHVAARG